ncbi:MAG: YeeE/YedE family protein [Halothiobacillaceae bacterium]|nr:YeeE/YedE family protein [Halothiobacillaceae bacterium]HER34675.1 transporter [Halothiobacillaceae bacterium]
MSCQVRPLWPPFIAGIVLGLVLLLTFILVGNGMGSSGAFARVATEVGLQVAPEATRENAYLGGMAQGNPLAAWIVLAAVGTFIGAILASISSGRFKVKVDRGSGRIGVGTRLALALGGGLLAGFGSRLAAGCTSGVGLSNTAMLGVAGFVFLIAFFVVGLLVSLFMRRVW